MRRQTGRLSLVAVALAAGTLAAGCGSGHGWGGGSEASSGIRNGREFAYQIVTLTCDGRPFLVLVADGCSGGSVHSSPRANGVLSAVDGRKVAWSGTTTDGTSGTVTIAGQQFDLAKGAVFLIQLKDKRAKVEQIAVDTAKLQGDKIVEGKMRERLIAVGDSEPRIKAFLKQCRGEK